MYSAGAYWAIVVNTEGMTMETIVHKIHKSPPSGLGKEHYRDGRGSDLGDSNQWMTQMKVSGSHAYKELP
jgi:hypothetical protein